MDEELDVENFPTKISEFVHAERNNLKIGKLNSNFYRIAKEALEKIHREMIRYMEEGREDDWMYAHTLLKKCRNELEALISMRIRKIFMMAWAGEEDLNNLTPEEKKLYMDFKDLILEFRNTAMGETIAEEKFEKELEEGTEVFEEEKESEVVKDEEERYTESLVQTEEEEKEIEDVNVLLYVLQDFPRAFASPDRNYRLRKEDVLVISKPFAEVIEEMKLGKIFKLPRF